MPGQSSKLASDRGGDFAIISVLPAVPLVLAVGLAVDATTIGSTRSDLQQAIVPAVLAVARVSSDKADAIARTFLQGNFNPAFTKLNVAKSGREFSVKAETTPRPRQRAGPLFRRAVTLSAGRGLRRHQAEDRQGQDRFLSLSAPRAPARRAARGSG